MTNELILEGLWWRPDYPQDKRFGTLRYASEETIELILKPGWDFFEQSPKQLSLPMIFGKLKDDTDLTLVDCLAVPAENETNIIRFSVSSVLQGTQLSKGESDHSEKDYAHFLQFSSWIKRF
ncbi:MAG TPA: hypothetical protein VHR47_05890 [Bacillota bacterium]|nr:hypothetical protein [Bacillota bacterium]